MKGVYSSPDSLMGRATQQALFPENTYGVDSGGDPLVIPSLTFDQFKNFHSSYYHPANSRIFFYGNDDPLRRLDLLDEYLSEFDRIPVQSQIQFQKKTLTPKHMEVKFPLVEGTEPKHMVCCIASIVRVVYAVSLCTMWQDLSCIFFQLSYSRCLISNTSNIEVCTKWLVCHMIKPSTRCSRLHLSEDSLIQLTDCLYRWQLIGYSTTRLSRGKKVW